MKNQTQIADEMITQTFGDDNFVALVVPARTTARSRQD